MNLFLLFTLLALLMMTPLRLTINLFFGPITDIAARLRVWMLPIQLHFSVRRDAKGHHVTLMGGRREAPPREAPPDMLRRDMVVLETFLRSRHTRRYLLRRTRLERLAACLRLSLRDAAATALLTGALSGLTRITPAAKQGHIDLRVCPDFLAAHTTLQAQCILSLRLGSLLCAAAAVGAAYLLAQQRHRRQGRKED